MNMIDPRRPPPSFRKGYALCSPQNILQPETFAKSAKKAIGKAFKKPGRKKAWSQALEEGWSVRLVYMRLFVPVFHATTTGTEVDDLDDED
jgi:hypothetical protein